MLGLRYHCQQTLAIRIGARLPASNRLITIVQSLVHADPTQAHWWKEIQDGKVLVGVLWDLFYPTQKSPTRKSQGNFGAFLR